MRSLKKTLYAGKILSVFKNYMLPKGMQRKETKSSRVFYCGLDPILWN